MADHLAMVREFHELIGAPVLSEPAIPPSERIHLRIDLLREETQEALTAFEIGLVDEIAKELADVLVVTYGAALEFGIDLNAVFAEVHRSNMSKAGPDGEVLKREDGKVLKGPHYQAPNVVRVLFGPPSDDGSDSGPDAA